MPIPTTQQVRKVVLAAIEGRFYSGPTAGQMWLADLSAYVQGLPDNDTRLIALARTGSVPSISDYLLADAQPLVAQFDPDVWFEQYTKWATNATAPGFDGPS